MSYIRRFTPMFVIHFLLIVTWQVAAQVTDCPTLVEQALSQVGNNCGEMGANVACYGFTRVDSTFARQVETGYFSQPADRTELTFLQTLQTSALNLDEGEWGIALMNVQANVPNSLPGQPVTFLMLGNTEIDNAVSPEDALALQGVAPIQIMLQAATDARSAPSMNASTIAVVPAGTTLDADALSREGDWLRVAVQQRPAWIARSAIAPADGLDALPTVTSTTRTPMQAFYFSTGFGPSGCVEAPNAITIQSPEGITIDLTVNGVDIRVGSTISFQNISENTMALMVHEGHVETVDGQVIETGQAITASVDPQHNITSWGELRPMTAEETQLGVVSQTILDSVRPTPPETLHTVAAGETLFSIARLYQANMADIAAANNIADVNSIFVGQELVIPNPGSGFAPIPGIATTISQPVDTGNPAVSCAGFSPTSPLDGLNYGSTAFYWNAAPGATGYRLNVYNLTAGNSISLTTGATNVTTNVDAASIGSGYDFAWDVQALLNGQVVCTSARVAVPRQDVSGPAFGASWACGPSPNQVTISYGNVPPGDTVTVSFFNAFTSSTVTLANQPVPPNSVSYSVVTSVSAGVVTTSSGRVSNLPPLPGPC